MRILVAVLLIVGAHFSLTALIPGPKAVFYWPFGPDSQPIIGFGAGAPTQILAGIAGGCLLAAAAALFGLLIPEGWFVPLVAVGSIASILLYVLYLGIYSIVPIAIDAILLWGVLARQWTVAGLRAYIFRSVPLVEQMTLNNIGDEHYASGQRTGRMIPKLGK